MESESIADPHSIDAVHELLDSIAARLEFLSAPVAIGEAKDFQRYGEEGLAWDMLLHVVNTHIAEVPGDVLQDLVRVAAMMGIEVRLAHSEF